MATPQTKSSQIPVKSTNPRNSEINPMRRSFSGNPFANQRPSIIANPRPGFNPNTPANSPSDYLRRNFISRNTVVSLRDPEEKENQNSKIRSPASSNGTKNFMSPTISAASKISPSPKKKILTERNEPARTSVSSSLELKPETGLNQKKEVSFDPTVTYLEDTESSLELKPEKGLNQKKEVSFDPTVTYLEDTEALKFTEDTDSVAKSESVASENDLVNLDPSFKVSPRISCSLPSLALEPLDAGPSMPPYDPKTNYLSPRPQFLHYKPNPQIELYRDGKQLEESFASESSSEAEVTREETVSDESSSDSHKEPERGSSDDLAKQVEEEEEEELLVSEPNPIYTIKGAIEARKASRPHFLTRTKFTALLFVLAIAGLWASVSKSPVMDPSVLNNLDFPSLYVPPEISEFTRENLEGLAQKFRQWLYDSLLFVHDLISSFIDRHKPGPLQFPNLTILLEDGSVDNHLLVDHSIFRAEVKYEIAEIQSLQEEDIEPVEGDENVEEEYSNVGDVKTDEVADDKDQEVVHIIPESGKIETSNSATELMQETVDTAEFITGTDVVEQPVSILNTDEIEPEVSDLKRPQAKNVVISAEIESATAEFKPENIESDAATLNPQTGESAYMALVGIKNLFSGHATTLVGIKNLFSGLAKFSGHATMAILISLTLLAAIPVFYMKNRTSTAPTRVPITKKFDQSPIQVTPMMEIETLGESCPSDEMSSSQYTSSYSNRKKETSEAQSCKKRTKNNQRRESMASSCSLGSASYGSFTTYEKVHTKDGNGEEGFVTPVRRSSRIRKQVTSP